MLLTVTKLPDSPVEEGVTYFEMPAPSATQETEFSPMLTPDKDIYAKDFPQVEFSQARHPSAQSPCVQVNINHQAVVIL